MAEIDGIPCGGTQPHPPHDWQYSFTGYCGCPGVPQPSEQEPLPREYIGNEGLTL